MSDQESESLSPTEVPDSEVVVAAKRPGFKRILLYPLRFIRRSYKASHANNSRDNGHSSPGAELSSSGMLRGDTGDKLCDRVAASRNKG